MFTKIRSLQGGYGVMFLDETNDVFSFLLGKELENISVANMQEIWLAAGKYILSMYRRNLKLKRGVG